MTAKNGPTPVPRPVGDSDPAQQILWAVILLAGPVAVLYWTSRLKVLFIRRSEKDTWCAGFGIRLQAVGFGCAWGMTVAGGRVRGVPFLVVIEQALNDGSGRIY